MLVIYGPRERLFWSNADGWGDLKSATVFPSDEREWLNLPIGGEWVHLEEATPDKYPVRED